MATWNDYKKHVRETTTEIGQDMDEIEQMSSNLDLEQFNRDNLAALQNNLNADQNRGNN